MYFVDRNKISKVRVTWHCVRVRIKLLQWKINNTFCADCYPTCHCKPYKNIVSYTNKLLWWIHFADNNKMWLRFHVKFPLILPIKKKIGLSWHIFVEAPNIKYQGNPSSESHADTSGQMDTGRTRQTLFATRWTCLKPGQKKIVNTSYACIAFACLAFANLNCGWPCIVIQCG